MNESMSDIFGYLVEAYYQDGGDWLGGEDVVPGGIRDMSHPPNFNDPDNINSPFFIPVTDNPSGDNDFGGVHSNSGIPNKVFYLLVTGDKHYGIEVPAMSTNLDSSRALTADVWYTWNAEFLTESDDFESGREKMLMVSSALFPGNSEYYNSIQEAWASVGVQAEIIVSLSNTYVVPNTGELLIMVDYSASGDSSSVIAEVIGSEGTLKDSVTLLDDGTNSDSLAGDNVWSGVWFAGSAEDIHFVNILAWNDSIGVKESFYGVVRFATIGPVSYESHEVVFNNGSLLFFDLNLSNLGLSTTALNVSAEILTSDSCVADINSGLRSFGDIAAGESAKSTSRYSITLNQNCVGDELLAFDFSALSGGIEFWIDNFEIQLEPIGVGDEIAGLPTEYSLSNAFPNPFNPTTTIEYTLLNEGNVSLVVYNLLGEEVARLVSENQQGGYHSVTWDASNSASGVYLYRLKAGDFIQTRKMVLLK